MTFALPWRRRKSHPPSPDLIEAREMRRQAEALAADLRRRRRINHIAEHFEAAMHLERGGPR